MEQDRRRRAAARRYNVVTVPVIRTLGLNAIALAVVLHHWLVGPAVSHTALVTFVVVVEIYCFTSWTVLLSLWSRAVEQVDIQFALLVVDVVVCVAATYVTGAERSWLFFLIALRLSDSSIGVRRTLVLAHLVPLFYLAMLWYAARVDEHQIPLGLAALNTYTLYGTSLYFVLIGRTAAALRARVVSAVHMSRDLIAQLQEKSERLTLSMEQATQASRAKSRFLATVSHELRTPLTAIMAQTQMLMDEADPDKDSRLVNDLAQVVDAARELSSVIDNLLEVSGIADEESAFEPVTFDVGDCVRDVAAKIQPKMDESGNAFRVVHADAAGEVRTDPVRLRRILLILLDNAAKFTSGGTVTLEVKRADTTHGPSLVFRVSDTGIGIPDEARAALFTPFMQVDESTTRKHGGTGVGLVIAKRYADLIGGELACETSSRIGTTFTLIVPMSHDTDLSPRQGQHEPTAASA